MLSKDGSAAIYGSRGANGVVLIETKKGGDYVGYASNVAPAGCLARPIHEPEYFLIPGFFKY
jgi:TonB-dependent SusC/RagA subfamily outer membrane receptor